MKRILLSGAVVIALGLAGCFDITDEITLNKNGSGVIVSTTDMGAVVSMMKSMATGGQDLPTDQATDTTVSLALVADSMTRLSPEEKALLKKAKLTIRINFAEDKMLTKTEIPFSKPGQIEITKSLSSRIVDYFLSKQSGESMSSMFDKQLQSPDPLGKYFTVTYSKGIIEKKLNKESYATMDGDEMMKALKEISESGMPITYSMVLNLPSPVKNTTGKGITISEDRKKVTIKSTSEDFFDDAAALGFRIEY